MFEVERGIQIHSYKDGYVYVRKSHFLSFVVRQYRMQSSRMVWGQVVYQTLSMAFSIFSSS